MRISTFVVSEVFTNCYLVQDEGTGEAVIIDPGEADYSVIEQIENIGKDKIKYILLTHLHFDHMLGAHKLHELTGAPVAIHKSEEKTISDSAYNGTSFFGLSSGNPPKIDFAFEDGDSLNVGDLTFKVMHTPGHTGGSCCFVCEDVIFSGDTLFCENIGRTDLPTGSMEEIIRSLKRLSELKGDYRVYPGHGEPTTLNNEREKNFYFFSL